jgi:hypothetical protein
MRLRALAFCVCCAVAASPASGQTRAVVDAQPRIRLTGPETFEMPGLVRIDRGQVTSGARVTGDETVLRFEVPGGQPLTVVRWHQRLVGQALGVDDGALLVRVEGSSSLIRVPLDSIGTFELSEARSHAHVLRGVLVGVGAFWALGALTFASCGLGCSDAAIIPAGAGGLAAGVFSGQGHERWTPRPASWLSSHFSGTGGR